MANIRITALTNDATPSSTDVVVIDGASTRKATLSAIAAAGRPFASQIEAEAGTSATVAMNPLTTKQAITAIGATLYASVAQGALADSAVQPGGLATVATTGAYSDLSGTPTLGTAAATAATDYAVAAAGVPASGTTGQILTKASGSDYDTAWTSAPAGSGDMLASAYDPQAIGADAFSRSNHTGLDDNTPYFPVQAFSATGDGSTNDRLALFNANAAAASAGAGLLLGPGTYLVGSALTFTVPIMFAGGKLKPASGIAITINSRWSAERTQIFDTSLGGTIEGTASLAGEMAMVEWWGALGDGSTPADPAANEASTFLRERAASTGAGGLISFGSGTFVITAPVTVDYPGGGFVGLGKKITTISYPDNISAFYLEGDVVAATKATYGSRVVGFSFRGQGSQPDGSIAVYCNGLTSTLIEDNEFVVYYRGIVLHHCRGPMAKMIRNNDHAAANVAPARAGSCFLLVEGGGGISEFSENVYVESNCGGGGAGGFVGQDYGILVTGVDVMYLSNNHGFGAKTACVALINDNSGTHLWNVHSSNNQWEPLSVAGTEFGVLISGSSGAYLKALFFEGDQVINGNTAGFCVQGTDPADILINGLQVQSAQGDSVRFSGGTNIQVNGGTLEDCDGANTGGSVHMRFGDGTNGPNGVVVNGVTMQQRISGYTALAGYYVQAGSREIQLNGGRVRGVTNPILSDVTGLELEVNKVNVRDSVAGPLQIAAAATISVPLGETRVQLTSGTSFATINSVSLGRELWVGNQSGGAITATHGSGNMYISGGSWAMPVGSWLKLQYNADLSVWIEIGRMVA